MKSCRANFLAHFKTDYELQHMHPNFIRAACIDSKQVEWTLNEPEKFDSLTRADDTQVMVGYIAYSLALVEDIQVDRNR